MNRKRIVALLAPPAAAAIAFGLFHASPKVALLWLLGLALGFGLHRSRFCVAAAFRDAILFGDTGLTRAVLLALALSSASFAIIQQKALVSGAPLPGNLYPISAATVAGALLFGAGLVPAGGCACSTLLRLGEGHALYLWVLAGIVAGSLAGAYHFPWWESLAGRMAPVHLPAVIGWPATLAGEMVLFGGLAFLAVWWERRGANEL